MELIDWDKELERIRQSIDPQEEDAFMYCENCKKEIYEGEDYYSIDAGDICEDCFEKYQNWERQEYRRTAGEN